MFCGMTSVRNPSRPRLTPSSGTLCARDQARRIEQGAVTANGDDQVRGRSDLRLGHPHDAGRDRPNKSSRC